MGTSPRIAVLMGGPSAEHDISLKSGQGVIEALHRRHWDVEEIVIPRASPVPEACEFVERALKMQGAEVAFIALHGPFGEDGTIQALCEELHVAYTGSDAAASRLGIDKVASRRRFEEAGLRVPRSRVVDAATRPVVDGWTFPLVVKPTHQGSSLGVSLVRQAGELPAALREAGSHGPQVLIEAFVAGRELTVGVLGDEPLPVVEIRPHQAFFDFRAKYTAGMTDYVVPAPLAPDAAAAVQQAGLTAHRALGCRHLSRTDLILTPEGIPVVLEVNTIPGFTPTSLLPKAAACIGLSYEALCEQVILMAWQGTTHSVHP